MNVVRLAILAGLVCAPMAAASENVRLSSPDGSIAVEGRLMGYDGEFYDIDTIYGPLTLDASRVICAGAACPDPSTYLSEVGLSGSASLGGLLMPALIERFAEREGYQAERVVEEDTAFSYVLTEPGAQRPAIRFRFALSNSDEGFADLLAGEADLALSTRQIRPDEIARAAEAGLGELNRPGRNRVLALDALVAVTGLGNPLDAITIRDLARVFAGEVASWSELGGPDVPILLHLRDEASGIEQGFRDRVMTRYGYDLAQGIIRHATDEALADAVADDPFSLGVTTLSEAGNAVVLGLSGPCGYTVLPGMQAIKTEDYPLTAPLFVYLPKKRLPKVARDFLSFVQSPAAAPVVRRAGFVDQKPDLIPLDVQGRRIANAVREAGRGVGLNDLRAMMDRLFEAERLSVTFRFEDGSSDMDAQSLSNIELLAEAIGRGEFDGRTLIFAGFSDSRGDAGQNRRLSERRAEAVRDAVVAASSAADASRTVFEVAGFGEAMPMACDEVEWGQRINRRVEVWVR